MFIIVKLNSKNNGELTVWGDFGKKFNTIKDAQNECKNYLSYISTHSSSRQINQKVGEYLMIFDSERQFQQCWYLYQNEIDYVRANTIEEVEEFAYSMANWKE